MKTVDGKNFECVKCGACCKWDGIVVLVDSDINRLAEFLKTDRKKFLSEYTTTKGSDVVLLDKSGTQECVFLEDNKCKVWDVKPRQCADFPKKYDKRCPGFRIKNRSDDMSDKYALAIKAVSEKLSGTESPDKMVMDGVYKNLQQTIKSASIVSVASENGIDPFLDGNRMKVASLDDLFSFDRIGSSQLIHKCTRDLWAIDSDKDGNVHITRLFDNSGEPVKG